MSGFYEEVKDIYRLKVPFDTVYTSVLLIKAPSRVILVDCATTAHDVEDVILPALAKLGYAPTDVDTLVLTHRHGDHAGGLNALLQHAPQPEVVTDIRMLADGVCTYPMGGHTKDAIGVLDTRTGTLISGDGLQGAGVDKYRCYTEDPKMYLETLARVREDARIANILFSHAYEPWLADRAFGREQVLACLDDCLQYVT
jgi:glyoxylase-like metal-dependent hydrolase (beta-lactamase superfamily II)